LNGDRSAEEVCSNFSLHGRVRFAIFILVSVKNFMRYVFGLLPIIGVIQEGALSPPLGGVIESESI